MDKIETALTATEDNAAAIRALANRLNAQEKQIQQLSAGLTTNIVYAKTITGGASFGKVKSNGKRFALIVFNTADKVKAYFGGAQVGNSYSPILARLPVGTFELAVTTAPPAYAVIFGQNSVYNNALADVGPL